jgi:creatinine amidohydrolase
MLTHLHTRYEIADATVTTAVLPVGAIEQHGRHLPVGTDLMLAEAVARELAARLDAYLLPPLAITSSIEHRRAKGTVYLRADTLALVVRDIADSLRQSGFTRLVLANFHGGNWILKPTIRQLNRDQADFRSILIQPELAPADHAAIFEHAEGDVHGGEYETSLMLHLYPEAVRPLVAPPPGTAPEKFPPQFLLDYYDITEITRTGHWGWPEAATAEKGRRAMALLIETALRFIRQVESAGAEP